MTNDNFFNQKQIDDIEFVLKHKKGEYLTKAEHDKITKILNSNPSCLFWAEMLPYPLEKILADAEMYYGFNKPEADRLLKKVNEIGYTFNYVDIATRNNGSMDHTVKLFALRKL